MEKLPSAWELEIIQISKFKIQNLQVVLVVKARDIRDADSIPAVGRSPGEEIATDSSILTTGENPWAEEPGKLPSIGSQSQIQLKQFSMQYACWSLADLADPILLGFHCCSSSHVTLSWSCLATLTHLELKVTKLCLFLIQVCGLQLTI